MEDFDLREPVFEHVLAEMPPYLSEQREELLSSDSSGSADPVDDSERSDPDRSGSKEGRDG